MRIHSSAFSMSQPIPARYSCQGEDVSPALMWEAAPAKTQSFALIVEDPDAPGGMWVHWVVYNLPPTVTQLAEGAGAPNGLPEGALTGTNDFHKTAYGGPCPPPGKPHHYHFKLWALDARLPLKAGATREEVLRAMKGHILGEVELVGTFARER